MLPLEPSPIGDAFVTADQCAVPQPLIPLDLALCRTCGHVQLMDVVNPESLFVDYLYQTQTSAGLVAHFRDYARQAIDRFGLQAGDTVVEIGSNDGSLLNFFQEAGLKVQGVDPSRAPAEAARRRGIPTESAFFSSALARTLRERLGPARLVVANNVFAHSNQLGDMADGVRELLRPDGVFLFEVSYLLDMIDRKVFDTIFHEHISYHSLIPLQRFLAAHGLTIFAVEHIRTKGGSIRVSAQRDDGPHPVQTGVTEMMAAEAARGLTEPAIFHRYAAEIAACRDQVTDLLDAFPIAPGTLAGYGASPTVATLIAHFRLAERLGYLVDDNPLKQGRFSPGWHHPVYPGSRLLGESPPPLVIILAWNYAEPIMQRQTAYRERGGRFLIPLPEPRIV